MFKIYNLENQMLSIGERNIVAGGNITVEAQTSEIKQLAEAGFITVVKVADNNKIAVDAKVNSSSSIGGK